MTVEELIRTINKSGWLVTELYQRHESEWLAALRHGGDFSSASGEGTTMLEALAEAWRRHKPRMSDADWDAVRERPKPRPVGVPPEGRYQSKEDRRKARRAERRKARLDAKRNHSD